MFMGNDNRKGTRFSNNFHELNIYNSLSRLYNCHIDIDKYEKITYQKNYAVLKMYEVIHFMKNLMEVLWSQNRKKKQKCKLCKFTSLSPDMEETLFYLNDNMNCLDRFVDVLNVISTIAHQIAGT